MRTYLDPTAPIARQALLVDDPKLAMDLAVRICESPRMSNLAHGLWGYHGTTARGLDLTVQSLGIGGPSAAIVVSELAQLGVRAAVRIGECVAARPESEPGEVIVPAEVEAFDGVGSALGASGRALPDGPLAKALRSELSARSEATASVDLQGGLERVGESRARAFDLGSAATLAAAAQAGVRCCVALVVTRSAAGVALDRDTVSEALSSLGAHASEVFEVWTDSGRG